MVTTKPNIIIFAGGMHYPDQKIAVVGDFGIYTISTQH
jgi:hypothetical protein